MNFHFVIPQALRKILPFILPSIIFLVLVIVFQFNGLYGQDSHEYYRYTKDLTDYFSGGEKPGNYNWPVFYPLSGVLLSSIISNSLFSLQLISFISFLLSIFFVKKILEFIEPVDEDISDVFILITFSLSPFLYLYSTVVMTELLSVFFVTGAAFFFFKYYYSDKSHFFLLFVFFSSSAFMTRYAAAVVLIIPVIFILIKFFRQPKWNKAGPILLAVLISVICLTPHFYLRENIPAALDNLRVQHWDAENFLRSSFSTGEGHFSSIVPNIMFVFSNLVHPYFIFFGILLLFFLRKEDWKFFVIRVCSVIIVLYAIFMAGFPFQNKRHLLLSFPFVIIALYRPFNRAYNFLKSKKTIGTLTLYFLLISQLLIFSYAFSKIYMLNQIEKTISTTLQKYDNDVIYTFFIDPALGSYGINKKIVNMWKEKINSFEKDGLVLFNEQKFKDQWKDKNPMINWNYLKMNYKLVKLESYDDGWELYEIEFTP